MSVISGTEYFEWSLGTVEKGLCPSERRFLARRIWRWRQRIALLALGLSFVVAPVSASEPSEKFLAGLRERGLIELGLDYLEQMESSPLATPQFQALIPYHRGILLIDQSRRTTDPDERAALLAEANAALGTYAASNPEKLKAAKAQGRLGNVLVEQAKQQMARAKKLPSDGAEEERTSYLTEARRLFDQARGIFESTGKIYSAEISTYPKTLDPKKEKDKIKTRQELRGRLAQARILAAQADYEKAKTFANDSNEFKELNEKAAKQFSDVFEEFSGRVIGYYAILYEGRCFQALGNLKKALGSYDIILSGAETARTVSDFRPVIAQAYQHQAECFIAQQQYDPAIARIEAWLAQSQAHEKNRPEWLALRFRLATALRKQAESLDDNKPRQRNLLRKARSEFRAISKLPGLFQQEARTAASELGRSNDSTDHPKTFAAAYDAARSLIDELTVANLQLNAAKKNDPDQVPALETQTRETVNQAARAMRLAQTLADENTDLLKVNEVRFYLCWLNFQQEKFYRSAILGEFLARRYPDYPASINAAKIAMASYERLYNNAISGGKDGQQAEFEAGQLADMAKFITRRWPDTPNSENAFTVLLTFALRHDRLEEARQLLTEVSPEHRPKLELKLGNQIWVQSLQLAQSKKDKEAKQLRQEAIALLQDAVTKVRKSGDISTSLATSALYLIQFYLSDGQYEDAITLLEASDIGPLKLIEQADPSASRPEYAAAVYIAALQAYVSVVPPQEEKMVATMEALEATGESADRLTKIYVGLGVQLEKQIQQSKDSGHNREAERIIKAFSKFVDHVAARTGSANWTGLNWIAKTYLRMGDEVLTDDQQAHTYFTNALSIYEKMITQAEQSPGFAPSPVALMAARKKVGICQRKLGEYKQSLNTFSSILKDKESRLDVQKEAAYTYQAWGEAEDMSKLEHAIGGGYKLRSTGKNRLWGWVRIKNAVKPYMDTNKSHRDTFFEAWLNIARCRYLIGTKSTGSEQAENFKKAKTTIRSISRQHPELGGEQWRLKFDKLTKEIQRKEGAEPQGLAEFVAVTH